MSKQKKNCQIPTPVEYVKVMLDNIGYTQNIYGKKVLENSCGEGNILIEIVKRFIADGRQQNRLPDEIACELASDIIGYEIDAVKLEICKQRLNELLIIEQIPPVDWNIKNKDFLKSQEMVDFIIGNPPYITYHDLTKEEREFVQEKFEVCKNGRIDYCYAFIEASIESLNSNGKMIYLVPYSIFRNKFAKQLRCYLQKYITDIWDYRGISVFQDIICSTVVILCEKPAVNTHILYKDMLNSVENQLDRNELSSLKGEKWIFQKNTSGKRRFGDFFEIYNSVATLCNKAFLIEVNEELEQYYRIEDELIEKEITYPAVSTKNFRKRKRKGVIEERIIFPYRLEGDIVFRYEEQTFQTQYPNAYRHLKLFKNKLDKRKADKNASWYEYGRSQALEKLWGEKLVIPMVITKKATAFKVAADAIPFAGYFIKAKVGSTLTLVDAKKIIESQEFYQYVQDVGTPTAKTSYRVSVFDIADYEF